MFSKEVSGAVMKSGGNISILSADLVIVGNIKSTGSLEIEGKVDGDIEGCNVTLRESAVVNGTIVAKTLCVKGKFKGEIKSDKLIVSSKGDISGITGYTTLAVEEGASIAGELKRIENFKEEIKERRQEKKKDDNKKADVEETTKEKPI